MRDRKKERKEGRKAYRDGRHKTTIVAPFDS